MVSIFVRKRPVPVRDADVEFKTPVQGIFALQSRITGSGTNGTINTPEPDPVLNKY